MRNRFKTAVILAGLLAFVFVFIMPDIPTPDSLVKEQPAIKPLIVTFFAIALGILELQKRGKSQRPGAHPESILELTCSRLC